MGVDQMPIESGPTKDEAEPMLRLMNDIAARSEEAAANGLGADVIASALACYAADLGRAEYGDSYLSGLAGAVLSRAGNPLPVTH